MRRATELVLRHRRIVLAAWAVALVLGSAGAANVGSLLANTFSLPGSPAQRGLTLLHQRFHQRSDGAFTLVVQATRASNATLTLTQITARLDERIRTSRDQFDG